MNRKDIIIIAVLMNTGLLAILFMMAGHTTFSESMPMVNEHPLIASAPEVLNHPVVRSAIKDELDPVVNAYTANIPPEPIVIDKEMMEPPKVKPSQPVEPEHVAPVQEENKYVEVKVKRGDSLDKIARANGTTIRALKSANNLRSDRLQIGQILRVPVGTKKSAPKMAPIGSLVEGAQYYTIKSGDNPWKIAKQFSVRFDQLLKLNSLNEEKARNLKVGDKIRVR